MAKRAAKKVYLIDIAILVLLAIVLGISMLWSRDIELKFGLLYYETQYVDEQPAANASRSAVSVSADTYPELKLHFVDVGQGDCTIIELPDGKTMIIDGGEEDRKVKTAITEYIARELPSGFKYFDYAILTHPDSDHCGSLDDVLNAYPARVSYRPNVEATRTGYTDPGKTELTSDAKKKDTLTYKNAIESMYVSNADFTATVYVTDPADESQTIRGGNGDDAYTYTFYSPLSKKYTDWNDYSPIMILEYRGFKFALSGDAEKKNEAEFVAKVAAAKTDGVTDKYDVFTDDYTVNLVKTGHHGSRTSTSQGYLDVITTEQGAKAAYYIISSNPEGNDYGHPHTETLERLAAMGVPESNILRTDTVGDIMLNVRVDENGVYGLYYGDVSQPDIPDRKTIQVLVYRKVGNIELKWALVAWVAYAVIVVVFIAHMVYESMKSDGANSGGGRKTRSGGTSRR